MEMIAREQDQAQPQDGAEQAGPYPIEQLQASVLLGSMPEWHKLIVVIMVFNAFVPQELGVSAAEIKKLKEGGVNTVEALAHATKRELCAIKGMSEAKVVKLQMEGETRLMTFCIEERRIFSI